MCNIINNYLINKLIKISVIFTLIFNVTFLFYHCLIHSMLYNCDNTAFKLWFTQNSYKYKKTINLNEINSLRNRILFFLYKRLLIKNDYPLIFGFYLFRNQSNFENINHVLKYSSQVKFAVRIDQINFYIFLYNLSKINNAFSSLFLDNEILLKEVGISKKNQLFYFYFSINDIIELMSKDLTIVFKQAQFRLVKRVDLKARYQMERINLAVIDVLSLASLIERETNSLAEKILISSVFYNRLWMITRLQTDPSVIKTKLEGKILKMDLCRIHQYNTYLNYGLTEPAWFPRKQSVHAALWPAKTDFFYFVSKNARTHMFCSKLICHTTANKQY